MANASIPIVSDLERDYEIQMFHNHPSDDIDSEDDLDEVLQDALYLVQTTDQQIELTTNKQLDRSGSIQTKQNIKERLSRIGSVQTEPSTKQPGRSSSVQTEPTPGKLRKSSTDPQEFVSTTADSTFKTPDQSKGDQVTTNGVSALTSVAASQETDRLGVLEVDRYGFVGGSQYTNPERESRIPLAVLRKREVKWLDMLENWEKWMNKRFKKVKDRCRKGIPPSIRPRAWQYLCGSKHLMEKKENRGRFDQYLVQPGDARCVDDIQKDIDRQYPHHEMFSRRSGTGQEDLFLVLKAYSIHNKAVGYCQAQAPLAAVLLMHMPAEQAFWCLVAICDKYLAGYYSPGLEAVQVDGDVLFGLLKKVSPLTYKHFNKQRVDPVLYMTEWFMCVFARTLPWPSVLRVWDMFLCEGVKVLFRVGLTLVRSVLSRPEDIAECPTLIEVVDRLRHIPHEYMNEDYLVTECSRLPVSEKEMEKEHHLQVQRRKAAKEDSKSTKKSKPKTGKVT